MKTDTQVDDPMLDKDPDKGPESHEFLQDEDVDMLNEQGRAMLFQASQNNQQPQLQVEGKRSEQQELEEKEAKKNEDVEEELAADNEEQNEEDQTEATNESSESRKMRLANQTDYTLSGIPQATAALGVSFNELALTSSISSQNSLYFLEGSAYEVSF